MPGLGSKATAHPKQPDTECQRWQGPPHPHPDPPPSCQRPPGHTRAMHASLTGAHRPLSRAAKQSLTKPPLLALCGSDSSMAAGARSQLSQRSRKNGMCFTPCAGAFPGGSPHPRVTPRSCIPAVSLPSGVTGADTPMLALGAACRVHGGREKFRQAPVAPSRATQPWRSSADLGRSQREPGYLSGLLWHPQLPG